jgi:diguanylate cyclase (GGDEF)-like protein
MPANDPAPAAPAAKTAANGDVDRLTGTLTREALVAATDEAIAAGAEGEIVAVGYVAIDGFAALDAKYGRIVTDHMLRETGGRILECLRPQDRAGRVERDEFMVVFRALTSKFETLALASKLRTKIAEPMRAGKDEVTLAPSCGIAQYPANGKTFDELRAAAEKATRALQVAMRTAAVGAAADAVRRAQAAIEAAQAELERLEAVYEEVVATAAAAAAAEEDAANATQQPPA